MLFVFKNDEKAFEFSYGSEVAALDQRRFPLVKEVNPTTAPEGSTVYLRSGGLILGLEIQTELQLATKTME